MGQYNTKQRMAVIGFFRSSSERGFTPEEAEAALPAIPRSSLYRLIGQLSDEGLLCRTGNEGRKAIYQYRNAECTDHMHIRCRYCGRTAHLGPEETRRIEEIVSSSGFQALDSTIIEGICDECRRSGV